MSPKKEAYLSKADAQVERDIYDEAKADYEKDLSEYQKQRDAWENAKAEHEGSKSKSGPYRSHVEPFKEPAPLPPAPPLKPFGYDDESENEQKHAETKKEREGLLQGRVASLYSSYGSRNWQMATTPPSIRDVRQAVRTAIYHGVEPYPKGHEGFAPYPKWNQVHQCDLGAADFSAILTAAKGWLKSPVLSKSIEGMVPDARFRAALDLAIHEGKYNRAIAPPLYNMMLAKLAGQPADETLLTVHTAKSAVSTEETEGNAMTVKFAKEHANNILGRLDKIAGTIQENHEKWGMDFSTAKSLVNEIDKTADEIEKAAFGEDSLRNRQLEVVASNDPKVAAVLQQDGDEGYMKTFNAPMAPHQTDSDEPYMGQFKDDQSQAVSTGKAENGRALAP
jgi:hypothetical protein